MREHPILFSGPMVRAILDGRKTQTRRVVTSRHPIEFLGGRGQEADLSAWGWFFDGPHHHGYMVLERGMNEQRDHGCISIQCPYGEAKTRLWVKETWRTAKSIDALSPTQIAKRAQEAGWNKPWCPVEYRADGRRDNWDTTWGESGKVRVSIHMPRWASRLTLEVTEVRVQRLQEISEEDARAEGVGESAFVHEGNPDVWARHAHERYRLLFEGLWDTINGERPGCSWADNPWVWSISFKRMS